MLRKMEINKGVGLRAASLAQAFSPLLVAPTSTRVGHLLMLLALFRPADNAVPSTPTTSFPQISQPCFRPPAKHTGSKNQCSAQLTDRSSYPLKTRLPTTGLSRSGQPTMQSGYYNKQGTVNSTLGLKSTANKTGVLDYISTGSNGSSFYNLDDQKYFF